MLRVAVLAPISWRVPPRHYGPWEQFASLLTEGLVERGVDVTLFATRDSQTSAQLASVVPRGYSEDPDADPKVSECLHIAHAFERAGEFDLIHNSFDFLPLTYSGLVETPVVTTIHGFSSPRILPCISATTRRARTSRSATPTAIRVSTISRRSITASTPTRSRWTRRPVATSCSSVASIPTRERSRRSTSPNAAGMPLVIAGIVQDERYFDEQVAPRIDGDRVRFIGAVGPDKRSELLGGAQALLHLIGFDEPFGYSVVEAMACGTPVIAFRRGSMPELIDDGSTGFLVDDVDGAAAAVAAAALLDRRSDPCAGGGAVRRRAHGRRYIDAYETVVRQTAS